MTTFSDSRNLPALSWKLQEPGIRLKYGVNLVNAKAETIFNYIGLENVESWTGRLTQTAELSDLDDEENAATGNKFRSGDVLFGKLRPYLAKAFVAEVDGCCTSELLVLRPIRYDSNYLKYLLLTPDFINLVNSSTYGAKMPRASWDFIGNISLPTLPLESQKLIARFLDRKTATIDTLIAKKQRLIQLLEEKRTALINQAVTKGLNPNAPMKDSGIPWIGEIPEHWEVKKLKWLCPYIMVGIVVTPAKYYVEFGIPCLRSLNIKPGKIIEENLVYISEESNEILSKSKIFVGDLVCVRTGQPGTTAVVDERFNGINCIDLIIIRKSVRASSDYISLMMNSEVCRSQYSMGTSGSIQQHFNVETATNLIICNPPLDEQLRIVERCQKIIEKHQILIQKVSDQIEKLQEYRRSLITAAVTGKLEISEAEADV